MIVKYTEFEHCSACLSKNLEEVFDMPKFPQIGIYLDKPDDEERFPAVDNGLMICNDCGHIQLRVAVDPEFMYDRTFVHRSSESPLSVKMNYEFSDYIKKISGRRRFKRVVDIGCNDGFLLKILLDIADKGCGTDPIWKGRENEVNSGLSQEESERIKVFGDLAENINFDKVLGGKPDLIVASSVMEHIKDPVELIKKMFEISSDDALFVIKVPGTDFMIDNARFDQLSHQHYQQFTLFSICKMLETAGAVLIDYMQYYTFWGSFMVAFKQGPGKVMKPVSRKATFKVVRESKDRFDKQIKSCLETINAISDCNIYGLGAAQNFPSLAYFMKDVSFLKSIIDDNPARQNKYYPGIPVPTSGVPEDLNFRKSAVMLTGPDYGRALIARARELEVRQIILPINVL